MTRLLLCTATILALTTAASAQGYFGGSDGGMGRSHGYVPISTSFLGAFHEPGNISVS
jgi:hypothetical protein